MKIAYCFAGHLRTFRQNSTLLKNLIGPNPGDVFVYTYAALNGGPRWHKDSTGDGPIQIRDEIMRFKEQDGAIYLRTRAHRFKNGVIPAPNSWRHE